MLYPKCKSEDILHLSIAFKQITGITQHYVCKECDNLIDKEEVTNTYDECGNI